LIDPSILKTERPPVTCARSKSYCGRRNRPTAPPAPPAEAGSFNGTFRKWRDVWLESEMRRITDVRTGRNQRARAPCRTIDEGLMCPTGKSLICRRVPFTKIFPFPPTPNHFYNPRHPVPTRGVSRSSRTRDGMRWTRQRFARERVAGQVERPVSDHRAS
jgi:hypothetical protein